LHLFVVVPRIQFLSVEIARNREGCNADLRRLFSKQKDNVEQSVSLATSVHWMLQEFI